MQPACSPCLLQGIVTRVGDVKPLMEVACYTCDSCGFEVYQEVTSDSFLPIARCPTPACLNNTANGHLHLQTRACKVRVRGKTSACSTSHVSAPSS